MLEINEAGMLTPLLRKLPCHQLIRYPEYDMMALPFRDAQFDLVVHSDSLEHVADPLRGLQECRRVLSPGGACIFTVPIIVGRLTKSRLGLAASLHGSPGCADEAMVVHTEFGADMWRYTIDAGFSECRIVTHCYPSGIALIAIR
jgi:ubiquinone/menaquinone biosynthesis C-methylase UbiE